MKDKNLYLFDLDGVIIDSKKNMKISWNSVNNKFRLNKPFKEYFSLIGRDFQDILKKMKIDSKNFENWHSNFERLFKNKENFKKIFFEIQ